MTQQFDPYLRWLGIRDPNRPPNYYCILGLELFEEDRDIISTSADRQMAHVRTFQASEHQAASQHVLNELSAARICLLNPGKKAAYDAELRDKLAAKSVAAPEAAISPIANAPLEKSPIARPYLASRARPGSFRRKPNQNQWIPIGIVALAGLSLLAIGVPWWLASDQNATVAQSGDFGPLAGRPAVPVVKEVSPRLTGVNSKPASRQDGAKISADSSRPAVSSAMPGRVAEKARVDGAVPANREVETAAGSHSSGSRAPNVIKASVIDGPVLTKVADETAHPDALQLTRDEPDNELSSARNAPPSPQSTAGVDVATTVAALNEPPSTGATNSSTAASDAPSASEKAPSISQKLPPPTKDAQLAVEKTILVIYKSDFELANHGTAEDKLALAERLRKQAAQSTDDPAATFVLLIKAQDLAIGAGNVAKALEFENPIAQRFDVDRIADLQSLLTAAARYFKTPEAAQSAIDAADSVIEEAVTADNFDAALRLGRIASGIAGKAHFALAATKIKNRSNEIEIMKKEFAKSQDAFEKLKTAPDLPDANLTVGNYLGLIKGNFEKALPYLVKASDSGFQSVAKGEKKDPTAAADQIKLADGWSSLVDKAKPIERAQLRNHAATWYRKALPSLKGLEKARVEASLTRLETNAGPAQADATAFLNALTHGSWTIAWTAAPVATGNYVGFKSEYKSVTFVADGTCASEFWTGDWKKDRGNSIVVRTRDKPTFFYRFMLDAGGGIVGEFYDPPDKLQCIGRCVQVR